MKKDEALAVKKKLEEDQHAANERSALLAKFPDANVEAA
jgi:hypothetical protein